MDVAVVPAHSQHLTTGLSLKPSHARKRGMSGALAPAASQKRAHICVSSFEWERHALAAPRAPSKCSRTTMTGILASPLPTKGIIS